MAPSPVAPPVVADIYNRVQTAVTNAGASTKLFTNEYNVLNNNSDQYGQFYSQHVESIRNAGGAVTGIATEYYNTPGVGQSGSQVDPSRAYTTWQNLGDAGTAAGVHRIRRNGRLPGR